MYYILETAEGLGLFRLRRGAPRLVELFRFGSADEALLHMDLQPTQTLGQVMDSLRGHKHNGLTVQSLDLAQLIKNEYHFEPVVDAERSLQLNRQLSELVQQQSDQHQSIHSQMKCRLALAHRFSRMQLQIDSESVDRMLAEAASLLLQIDSDTNTYIERLAEWCSWSFPELISTVGRELFVQTVTECGGSKQYFENEANDIQCLDIQQLEKVREAALTSTGSEITAEDQQRIAQLAVNIHQMQLQKTKLITYITSRASKIAPQLSSIVGPITAAKLLTRAKSLQNLARLPASTIQILGAELTFFNAKKEGGKTPKFGFVYEVVKDTVAKGPEARRTACKAAIAARMDFSGGNVKPVVVQAAKKAEKLQKYKDEFEGLFFEGRKKDKE